jgi:cell division protein FtsI/penicillin-binding protein 2
MSGMVKISERMSHEDAAGDRHSGSGSGRRPASGCQARRSGIVTSEKNWSDYSHTSVVIGHEVAVTPVQMVRAFGAYARPGDLAGTLPHLKLVSPTREELHAEPLVRVLEPDVALRTRRVLTHVADRMDASLRRRFPDEPEPRYTLFGKSGRRTSRSCPPSSTTEDGERVQMGRPKGAGATSTSSTARASSAGRPSSTRGSS